MGSGKKGREAIGRIKYYRFCQPGLQIGLARPSHKVVFAHIYFNDQASSKNSTKATFCPRRFAPPFK